MKRRGFTLVELLMVMVIMTILAGMSWAVVASLMEADRVRSASRSLQAAIAGCRDRAIKARSVVGLRLIRDGDVATTMVYIDAETPWTAGTVRVEETGGEEAILHGTGTGWKRLFDRGILQDGTVIELFGIAHVADTFFLRDENYDPLQGDRLIVRHIPNTDINFTNEHTYSLHLPPSVRPNQEPIALPTRTVVDINRSRIPGSIVHPGHVDLLFSPAGTMTGAATASGFIHLLVRDAGDALDGISLSRASKEQFSVTIMPKAGLVSTYRIRTVDNSGNGEADDPFLYAETGSDAGY